MAKTNLGKVSVTPRGEWVQGTMYARLDVVSRSGGSYMSIVDNNYSSPGTAGAWMQVAKIGKDGRSLIVLNNGNVGYWDSAAQQWVDTGIAANTATLDPSNIGLTDVHTNINSLDNPTLTMQDPEDPNNTVVKTLATIEDIPDNTPLLTVRVTEMLTIPSDAEFIAEHHLPTGSETRSYITLRAHDTTDVASDLTITCALGFGSPSAVNIAGTTAVDNGDGTFTYTPYVIKITAEQGITPSTIFIPKECNNVDIFWFVGPDPDFKASYWVDLENTMHPFTAADTPIANFSTYENGNSSVVIHGVEVVKKQVANIFFGSDYIDTTAWPDYFLLYFTGIRGSIDLSSFINVVNCGDFCLSRLTSLNSLDISMIKGLKKIPNRIALENIKMTHLAFDFSNATSGGFYSFANNKITHLDLSTCRNFNSISDGCFASLTALISIQLGSVEWSSISLGGINFTGIPNVSTSILYADTQDVVDAFKAKVPSTSNWTVVINETPTGA